MASERPPIAVSSGTETAGSVAISPSNGPGDHAACDAEIARLRHHLETLGREHARHALAVSVHKGRADQQESRAVRAEKQLARFAGHAEEYDGLAEQAAQGQRDADLVAELRRRIVILERQAGQCRAADARLTEIRRAIAAFLGHHGNSAAFALQSARNLAEGIRQVLDRAALEPLSAVCADCGEQFADSETGEYLFATRERMERLLYADGWADGPVLCPACREEEA